MLKVIELAYNMNKEGRGRKMTKEQYISSLFEKNLENKEK